MGGRTWRSKLFGFQRCAVSLLDSLKIFWMVSLRSFAFWSFSITVTVAELSQRTLFASSPSPCATTSRIVSLGTAQPKPEIMKV